MVDTNVTDDSWSYASLSLEQGRWPGLAKAEWVATSGAGELFRAAEILAAMNRLGAEGWVLVTFAPEWGDRSATYWFKRRSTHQ